MKEWLSQQDGVASVDEPNGGPALGLLGPWYGTLRAQLVTGAADEDVLDLADAVADRLVAEQVDTMSVELADGDWAFVVDPTRGANADALSRLREFQSESDVVGARVRGDLIQLIANRADIVDVYRAHPELWDDLLVTADDEASALISKSTNGMDCSISPALDFASDILSDTRERPTSWFLSIDPCGEVDAYVPFDDLVASADDLRVRMVNSPSAGSIEMTVNSSPNQKNTPPQVSVQVSDSDVNALRILELASEAAFGSTSMHAFGPSLSFRNSDLTVCQLLDLVRRAPGIEQYPELVLNGADDVGVMGERKAVVRYIDSNTRSGGCAVTGRIEL